ncbi:unnamed protein product [Rhizophagus irregularis]|nr:unnamed protein product [Rhizophagus irregularis]
MQEHSDDVRSNHELSFRVGFRSTETPKIRSAFGWASEVQKLQRFVQLSGGASEFRRTKKTKIRKFGGLSKNENLKIKICSSGLPKNENPKIKIYSGELLKNENPKIKIHSGGLPKNKNPKIKIHSGGFPKNENLKIKIYSGELLKNENLKIKICSGRLLKNENLNIKIRSGRLLKIGKMRTFKIRLVSQCFRRMKAQKIHKFVNRKPRFVSGKVEPRFVSLVSQADSKEQKKTKDSFNGFPKNQDSRTLGEWQRTAAKKSAKVQPALDHKSA